MKEKDLEAMLIAQRKVLEQIDSKDNKEQQEIKEKSSKKRHKRQMSTNDNAEDKLIVHKQSKGKKVMNFIYCPFNKFHSGSSIFFRHPIHFD